MIDFCYILYPVFMCVEYSEILSVQSVNKDMVGKLSPFVSFSVPSSTSV